MAKTPIKKMRDYRRRLRAQGLRPIQIWVPDLRDPKVRERISRQLEVIAHEPTDPEIEALQDAALAEIEGWTA
jgi:hypothetical protein